MLILGLNGTIGFRFVHLSYEATNTTIYSVSGPLLPNERSVTATWPSQSDT